MHRLPVSVGGGGPGQQLAGRFIFDSRRGTPVRARRIVDLVIFLGSGGGGGWWVLVLVCSVLFGQFGAGPEIILPGVETQQLK